MRLLVWLICISILAFLSCSDDEESKSSNLEEVEFAFDQTNPPIDQELINNLSTSSDFNAVQITTQLALANAMSVWLSFFETPTGAVSSNEVIGSCGGNALVYTYSYNTGTEQLVAAYQICETDSKYIFQVFWSIDGGNFQEILYAEESKGDLREGLMRVFAADPTGQSVATSALLIYTWQENADGVFTYGVSNDEGDFVLNIVINADDSGSLEVQNEGFRFYEATWNAAGSSGTYKNYDSSGNLLEEGNWPAT